MTVLLYSHSSFLLGGTSKLKNPSLNPLPLPLSSPSFKIPRRSFRNVRFSGRINACPNGVTAFFFNPTEDPIVKEALKEPVAFMGGVFAGFLRLDLTDDPLKEWLTRTVESSGITNEEVSAKGSSTEVIPVQIEIE